MDTQAWVLETHSTDYDGGSFYIATAAGDIEDVKQWAAGRVREYAGEVNITGWNKYRHVRGAFYYMSDDDDDDAYYTLTGTNIVIVGPQDSTETPIQDSQQS
jgi:hypothetical protein